MAAKGINSLASDCEPGNLFHGQRPLAEGDHGRLAFIRATATLRLYTSKTQYKPTITTGITVGPVTRTAGMTYSVEGLAVVTEPVIRTT